MIKKRSLMRKSGGCVLLCAIVFGVLGGAGVDSAAGQVQLFTNSPDTQIATHNVRQKAPPDECWAYLASPPPLPMWTDPADCAKYATNPAARPKVNQSYIWAMAETEASIWFGTVANGGCITSAGSTPGSANNPNGSPSAYATESSVCEYYNSPYYPGLYPDARIGDTRTPRPYQYIKATGALTDKTPKYENYITANNPEGTFPGFIVLRGIRAAAAYNDVVLMAGPHLSPSSGIIFFAWNATSGDFLGARQVLGYNNIRQFLNLNGILYSGVGTNDGAGKVTGGAILRLNPAVIPNCTFNPGSPFTSCFVLNGTPLAPQNPEIVGALNTVSGTLTAHNGRIFTATWASTDIPGSQAHLYMSPAIPPEGLTNANANQWTTLWKASDYEPDSGMAQSYAGGGIASFDGYLWWGTLHIPMAPFLYLLNTYPPTTSEEVLQGLAGTFRSTVLFRIKDPDTNPQIDLVYGNYRLPVFTPPSEGHPGGSWSLQVNNMGKKSLWGPSGYGDVWNTYTWSATVWKNRLWIGTMDYGLASQQGATLLAQEAGVSFPPNMYSSTTFGGDLLYFVSASKPAFPESTNGVDNPTTYGIRNQLRSMNGNLFLGMANAMNLLTDPADPLNFGGLGGWELIELSESASLNTPAGTDVAVTLPDGVSVNYCSVSTAGTTFSSIVPNTFKSRERFLPLLSPYNLNGPGVPAGVIRQPTKVVLLWSSASWGKGCASSTLASVSVPYTSDVIAPRLLQLQWDGTQYDWVNITTSVDSNALKVSGAITEDYMGVLAVAGTIPPSVAGTIVNKGTDPVNGYFVDVVISNTGRVISAENISIEQLGFEVLAGTGTVSYNTAVSPALPISLGNLEPGANAPAIRLYLNSTTAFGGRGGVLRFSITETMNVSDGVGGNYTVQSMQTLIP